MKTGKFICVDGPHGAGKSTLVQELSNLLSKQNIEICLTKEPTESKLGRFIRREQDNFKGQVLACLVTADRYDHIEKVINPNLRSGKTVISNRYFPSSLVYQAMDGVEPAFIWKLNEYVIMPDLLVFVSASPKIITKRLNERKHLTRFEYSNTPQIELSLFKSAFSTLRSQGYNVLEIQNDDVSVQDNSKIIYESVIKILEI